MKSAYEIAMGRLEKEQPSKKLTAAQKKALADIDSECAAKIAERRLLIESEIAKTANNPGEQEQLRKQLASEITRLEEKREAKKEKVRS